MQQRQGPALCLFLLSLTVLLVAAEIETNHHKDKTHNHETEGEGSHHNHAEPVSPLTLWLYGTAAVVFISVCGLLAITTIPKIASHHHGDILQLLVGLAIGTLTSDALLHLLPHVCTCPCACSPPVLAHCSLQPSV